MRRDGCGARIEAHGRLAGGTYAYATAEYGNGNDALVIGDNTVHAGGYGSDLLGNNDIATLFGDLSQALSGANEATDVAGSFDFAGVFGDNLTSTAATGGNFLFDILPGLF